MVHKIINKNDKYLTTVHQLHPSLIGNSQVTVSDVTCLIALFFESSKNEEHALTSNMANHPGITLANVPFFKSTMYHI